MKYGLPLILTALAVGALSGCSGGGGEEFDANKIAVKQPGNGPPPLAHPGDSKPTPPTKP